MKRCILLPSTVLFTLVLASSGVLLAGDYQDEINFTLNDLTFSRSGGFDFVTYRDGITTLDVGAPCLPIVQVNVAIPAGAVPVDVRVLGMDTLEIDGQYDIMPNAEPIPVSAAPKASPFFQDPAVYGRDAFYPGVHTEIIGSFDLVGQDFVTLNIYPLQYNPVTRKLVLSTRVSFALRYRASAHSTRATFNFSGKVKDRYTRLMKAMSINPEDVGPIPDYVPPLTSTLDPGNYEYVIITTPSFIQSFEPLADWRTQMGIPAKIVDTAYIYANYSGTADREKIKNFIKDANTTWGSIYFLLGGDTGYIPYQKKLISGEYIPNDTYYARLNLETISWKYNVYVGRACVNNTSQTDTFVNKVLTYEKSPPSNFGDTVFFMGFDLDGSTHGEGAMEIIRNEFIPATSDFEREYDSESGGHESDVKNYMSQGKNLVNHCDHCNTSYLGVGSVNHGTGLNNTEAKSFTNGTRYSNFYTIGCWAGNYPDSCWGEALVNDDQGGITFVGNSRYGWYTPGNPMGYSMGYDKQWWRALFDPSFNAYRAGETLAVSLNLVFPGPTLLKYIFTELNLFGDPALHLWTENPGDLDVFHATSINTGSQFFTVHVESNAAGLEGALVCVMKDSEVYDFKTTDASGDVLLDIDPASIGTMTVTVTAQNHKYYEGNVDVTLANYPPEVDSITPRCGLEAGATAVTITGKHFTAGQPVTVSIGGKGCTNLQVIDDNTLTCQTPAGSDGWSDVEVSNTFGNAGLIEGYRYFPAGQFPFNGTDVHTESVDAPAEVTLIASGYPSNPFIVFFSFGGGPNTTPFGTMGLDLPINYAFAANLNNEGYFLFPLAFTPGYGPMDFFIHIMGLDVSSNPVWSMGGNNPNASGSLWFHVNN